MNPMQNEFGLKLMGHSCRLFSINAYLEWIKNINTPVMRRYQMGFTWNKGKLVD